jgi:dienelactone hydrolase
VVDWLVKQPQVDPDRIVLIGSSMGSWCGARCAAVEPRLKAVAGNMAAIGDKLVDSAQPSFLANLAFMTGIADVDQLHGFIADMTLVDVVPKVKCPYLVVVGENDELTTLESTRATYEKFGGARELWIYEREFHPIGPTCAEWLDASLDWLSQAIEGRFAKDHKRQVFITRSGQYIEGSGEPPWWNP